VVIGIPGRRGGSVNISTEQAMLFSALIALGASLLTLLVSELFRAQSEKRKEAERFFYEIYSRRLALYEDVLKSLEDFFDIERVGLLNAAPSSTERVVQSFYDLSFRCDLLASGPVADSLKSIEEQLNTMARELGLESDMEAVKAKVERLSQSLSGKAAFLRKQIRTETCTGFVDRFLSRFSGTTTTTDHGNTP
jgi:hypothetical protein